MSTDSGDTTHASEMARFKASSQTAQLKTRIAREPHAVTYESIDGVALITINRPPDNWLNVGALEMLHDAWVRLNASDDRCAILTGAGNEAFCSGGQPDEFTIDSMLEELHAFYRAFPGGAVKLKKPLIGAVAGKVVGGSFALTMMMDMLVAAENTVFSYPEAQYSVGGGLIAPLASRIPHKVAMELMLVGEPMSVQRAYKVGFVNEIVPVGQQVEAAMRYARRIADNGPIVVSWFKSLADRLMPEGPAQIAAGLLGLRQDMLDSEDVYEMVGAVKAGRKPIYKGR
jgi:enoyl-CoA hydratase